MRYEDASQAGSISSDVNARDDSDHLAGNDFGPATGNLITGSGTVSGATGTDVAGAGGQITAIVGAGGSDSSFDASGMLEVAGQYGKLTIDADGNYTYVRNPDSPEGVADTFTYTLASNAGATDTAQLVINIGNLPILQAEGTQTVRTADGVVVLPPGVELSDVRVVGRDLVITLPDGSTMVIPDGAVFVPQLVVNGVEVPASNLAALLIDSEPRPAAGDSSPTQLSSGGNFEVPLQPLDPGVPLGDLLPPTELFYTPPEIDELFDTFDNDPPVITASAINVSEEGVSAIAAPNPDNAGSPDTTNNRIVNGHIDVVDSDGDAFTITLGSPTAALTSQGVPITWAVSPDGHTVTGSAGGNTVITLVIENDGDYTVTLSRPIDHPNGGGEQGSSFVVPVFATDGEDDAVPSSITVTIEDDSPTITGLVAEPTLVVDDTTFNVNDTDAIGGAFAVSYGADGAAAVNPITYAMGFNAGATGLFDTLSGDQVVLTLEAGVVVGRAGAGGPIVFTVSVDGSGNVTLDQSRAVVHNDPNDPAETGNSTATLAADNLVTVSIVATDRDGDPASITINIGQNLRFEDDGPSIERNQNSAPTLVTDDTDTPNDVAGPVSFAGLFTAVFGNDGPKDADDNDVADSDAIAYSLSITGGNGTNSGLVDVLSGDAILLRVNAAGDIEGYLAGSPATVAFTIDLNPATGAISLEQDRAITHNDPTDPIETGSSAATLAANLVVLTATITDGDGDTDTATANIGGSFQFEDDGPSIDRNATAAPTLVTDDTDTPNDVAGPVSFAALFTSSFGKDGPKDVDDNDVADADALTYSLSITGGNGTNSGLVDVLSGDAILLRVNGAGDIEGYLAGSPGTVAFTIDLDASGNITLEQDRAITHNDPTDPVESGSSAATLAANLVVLTATITDGDGDTDSATANIGNSFQFEDDGPSIERNGQTAPSLVTDDTDTPNDVAGPVSFAGLFTADFGADGPKDADDNDVADADAITYSLSINGGNGTDSGLNDVLSGDNILLRVNGAGDIEGYLEGSPGTVAFIIDLNPATGQISLEQDRAITHDDPSDPVESGTSAATMASNLIVLNATITDGDGDTDTATANIGDAFRFEDDGPAIDRNQTAAPTLVTDDTDTPNDVAGPVNFAGMFDVDFGADGPKDTDDNDVADADAITYSLSITGGNGTDSGLNDELTGDNILLRVNGSGNIEGYLENNTSVVAFTITVNSATGQISLEQDRAITHNDPTDPVESGTSAATMAANLIVLNATITDGDGDTDTAAANIGDSFRFEDDGPDAQDEPQQDVAEGNNTISGTFDFDAGADGGGVTHINNIVLVFGGDGWSQWIAVDDGQIRAQFDGSYEFQSDASGSGVTGGTYTVTDGDGDPDTANWAFNITDANAPTAGISNARLDDDGLGGNPASTAGDIDANVGEIAVVNPSEAIFHGQLTLNFGGDGAGTVTFAEMHNQTGTVGTETVRYTWSGNTLTATIEGGLRDDTVLFDIVVNTTTGEYTLTLRDNVLHAPGGDETSAPNVELTYTVTDSDNSPAGGVDGTLNITFNDDAPTIDRNQTAATPLVTDDTDTPNDVAGPTSFAALFTGVFGADGPKDVDDNGEDADALRFSLSITGGNGTDSGLDDVLTGDNILLRVNANGDIEGYLQGSPSTVAFTIDLDPATGAISLEQDRAITHNDPTDPIESGTSAATLASGLVVLTATIEDDDGDTDTATANIGDAFRFEDDGPAIDRNVTVAPVLVTDDTDTPNDTASGNFAALFTGVFGKDGFKDADDNDVEDADAIRFSMSITGGNGTDSGLNDAITGDDILLRVNASGDIEGYLQDSPTTIAFTIDLDPATGQITLEQDRAIQHNDPTDPIETGTSAAMMAANLIVLTATIEDGDGDTDTATANIGDAFRFEDDGPSMLIQDPLEIENSGTQPSGTGTFVFDVGADTNADSDDISLSGFTVLVNGIAATNVVLIPDADADGNPSPETATTASYYFSFDYSTGEGGTETAEGILVFNKLTQEYTVTLTTGPIEGFTILQTGDASTDFVEYDTVGTGAPDVITAQLADDLFAQFTAFARPNAAGNHISTVVGSDAALTAGDLFTAAAGNPQVSESDAGVNGNTMDTGEVLDFDLFTSDPGSNTAATPDGFATEMFIQFFQYSGDDIIVNLKLGMDTNDDGVLDTFTTRAILIDEEDVFTDSDTATGTAYEGLVAGLGSQDALVVIQSNDYNAAGEEWVIVGAQIVTDEDGTTGTGIDLDGDLGLSGASDRDGDGDFTTNSANPALDEQDSFTEDTDVSGLKITSIGFVVPSTTDQEVTIEFDVTVTDADGDSVTQDNVTVLIGDAPETLAISSTTKESGPIVMESLSTTSSLLVSDSQTVERIAANSNSVTLAAAVAAAGVAASSAAAAKSTIAVQDDISTVSSPNQLGTADLGGSDLAGRFSGLNMIQDGGFDFGLQSMASTSHGAIAASHIGELTANLAIGSGPNALLEATELGAMLQMPIPTMGMDVAMPSVESLMPQVAGVDAQMGSSIGLIVADALQGGGSTSIDTLLSSLPSAGNGGNAGLHGLATQLGGDVSTWDMGHSGGFTFDVASIITTEAMVLHHDAVQPVANG